MLTWFLSPKSLGLEHDGEHAVHMMANHLAEGYTILETGLEPNFTSSVEISTFDKSAYEIKDKEYLAPVVELGNWANNELSDHLIDFMIHGSLATLDYSKGWSDFDTFLIVSSKTATNGHALTELRSKLLIGYEYLLSVDPLQHHGFLLCTEIDLRRYNESIMPLLVLNTAKSYFGKSTHLMNSYVDPQNDRENLKSRSEFFRNAAVTGVMDHHAYQNVYLKDQYRNAENGLFQFKYLIGNVALAPCYYAGSIGSPATKPAAIELVKPLLSQHSHTFLENATRVRSEWQEQEEFPYSGNEIPAWVRSIVHPDYLSDLSILLSELESLAESK